MNKLDSAALIEEAREFARGRRAGLEMVQSQPDEDIVALLKRDVWVTHETNVVNMVDRLIAALTASEHKVVTLEQTLERWTDWSESE